MKMKISKDLKEVRFIIITRAQRFESMRDVDLREGNYSKAAALNERAHGLRLAAETIEDYCVNAVNAANKKQK